MKNTLKTAGTVLLAAFVLGFGGWLAARAGQETVASRAYVGHENDADMRGFVRQYPATAGTRLDDCQTCHRGGVRGTDTEREVSPCSYCHLLVFPNAKYKTGVPKNYEATLNAYGLDYKKAGRAFGSFAAIDGRDSDGDGDAQRDRNRRPPQSRRPGQPAGPAPGPHGRPRLGRDPRAPRPHPVHAHEHDQGVHATTTSTYRGVRVIDLLSAAKIYLTGVTGITVFAPDGYSVDYTPRRRRGALSPGLSTTRAPPPSMAMSGPSSSIRRSRPGRGQERDAHPRRSLAHPRLRAQRPAPRSVRLRGGDRQAGRRGPLPARSSPSATSRAIRRSPDGPTGPRSRRRFGDGWDYVPENGPQRRRLHPRRLRHPDQPDARGIRGIRLEERLAAHRRAEDRDLRPRRPLKEVPGLRRRLSRRACEDLVPSFFKRPA